jgi:predicted PurR-regulated permease PerM
VFVLAVVSTPNPSRRALLTLLVLSFVAIALVARPIAGALLTALVLAVAIWPLQVRLTKKLRGRSEASAGILTATVIVLCAVPVVAVSAFVVDEGSDGVEFVANTLRSEGVTGLIERLPGPARKIADELIEMLPRRQSARLDETVKQQVAQRTEEAAFAVGAMVAATGQMLFQLAMMTIALYCLLAQGDQAVGWIEQVSPLGDGRTRELLVELKKVSYALVMSMVVTSAVQAIAAFVGYLIARVPHPVFFAALTFVIAFIPALGAAFVCLFAALLLLATGHTYAALFLVIWGLVVVGLVDNLIKPYLIKNEVELPGAVVFFALIGGLAAFGGVGLLIGPIAVALFVIAVRMYRRDFAPAHIR